MQPTITPNKEKFAQLATQGNVIPVHAEFIADLDTPVSTFAKLAPHSENHFFLESVAGGETWGRYSFIGVDPPLLVRFVDEQLVIEKRSGGREVIEGDPLDALRSFLGRYQPVHDPTLPRFSGGLVGYLSYDMVRHIEALPQKNRADAALPLMAFMLSETLVILDHFRQRGHVVVNVHLWDNDDLDQCYGRAVARIAQVQGWLATPCTASPLPDAVGGPLAADEPILESNISQGRYESMVEQAKAYIRAGDAFQIVLSQRQQVSAEGIDLVTLYRRLRLINPSPYMFFLRFGDLRVIGASPEVLVRLEDGVVDVRPIAGTRPRGETADQDHAIAEELLRDPKELAEHVMLVDLGRNDVGRVAQVGTVSVTEQMVVERYSHVMHLVSNVRGRLRPGLDAIDVVRATFPAGTLSGAPKVRAMEIIEELEPTRRGIYGGAVGYFSFTGNMDLCIAIRTLVAHQGKLSVQAGAGIVYDSIAEREHQECRHKAAALLRALGLSQRTT